MGKQWIWLAVHLEIRDSPKLRALYKMLDISKAEAVGFLVLFWMWATSNCSRDGEIISATIDDIDDAVGWKGRRKRLSCALADAGWIDTKGSRMYIHDWLEYAKPYYDYQDRLERDRLRKAGSRAILTNSEANEIPVDIPTESPEELPVDGRGEFLPLHNNTLHNNKDISILSDQFTDFWTTYPRKDDKQAALRCWKARIKEGIEPTDMITAAKSYAAKRAGQDPQFTKQAKTFIGRDKPYLDYLDDSAIVEKKADEVPDECMAPLPCLVDFMREREDQ